MTPSEFESRMITISARFVGSGADALAHLRARHELMAEALEALGYGAALSWGEPDWAGLELLDEETHLECVDIDAHVRLRVERDELEEALSRSEERHRRLIEALKDLGSDIQAALGRAGATQVSAG